MDHRPRGARRQRRDACSSTPRTATPRPRRCRTRSSRTTRARPRRPASADGIVVTPVAQPARATAASSTTRRTAAPPTPTPPAWIADRANELLADGLAGVKRMPLAQALGGRHAPAARLPRRLRRRPAARRRPRRDPRRRRPHRRRPARRRERRLLGRDRRAARPRPDRGQPARRPDVALHDARLGRQDPDGLLVPVRDGRR